MLSDRYLSVAFPRLPEKDLRGVRGPRKLGRKNRPSTEAFECSLRHLLIGGDSFWETISEPFWQTMGNDEMMH